MGVPRSCTTAQPQWLAVEVASARLNRTLACAGARKIFPPATYNRSHPACKTLVPNDGTQAAPYHVSKHGIHTHTWYGRARFKWGENDASQISDCHNGACAAWLQPASWRTTGGRAVSVAGARGIRRAGTGSLGVRRAVGATAAASRNIRETRCCLPRAGAAA